MSFVVCLNKINKDVKMTATQSSKAVTNQITTVDFQLFHLITQHKKKLKLHPGKKMTQNKALIRPCV